MSDVFISYARPAEAGAKRIADALRALGYRVWRDDELPAHRDYSEVIEERLRVAKAVVVVWSADAVKSQWVRAEADLAREAGTLVQLSIDGTALPMPFNRIQCADLRGWSGELNLPGWTKVAASVAELVGRTGAPTSVPVRSHAAASAEPLLAVLAFDNLSGDPDMAYFSDGVSEEIQETVARGAALKVVGRTSAFQLRGADKSVRKVVSELRATHVLDGSVRRAGQRVRISAQLIECAGETTLWSDRFDRELEDIFALQDEIAGAVAEALKRAFAPRIAPSPIDPEVYERFLKAQEIQHRGDLMSQAGNSEGLELLGAVVASSPNFARAWELLAAFRAFELRRGWSSQPFGLARAAAEAAVERALALDQSCGGAYAALAELEPWGAYKAREEWVLKALAASPGDPNALAAAARAASSVGRRADGTRYSNEARLLDPLLAHAQFWYASSRAAVGRTDEALAIFETLVARGRAGVLSGSILAWASGLGRWDLFDRWRDALLAGGADAPGIVGILAHAERLRRRDPASIAAFGDACRAEIAATGTIALDHLRYLEDYGELELAFELAETASFAHMFRTDGPPPSGVNAVSVIFIPKREGGLMRDPRFARLCAKLGHVHYWLETGKWPDCADHVPYDFRAECHSVAAEGLAAHV